MLKLKNIKKDNGIISADYDPECSGDIGKITMDVKTGEVIQMSKSNVDIRIPIYLNHAIDAVYKIKDKEEIAKEKLVMWY